MNFKKLQAMQEELDNAILADKAEMTVEERFNKTLVALSVEVAEIANCAEHFKFWKDNKGKVDEKRFYCIPQTQREDVVKPEKWCELSNQSKILTRQQAHKLTLVEECSDALHFILSLANQSYVDLGMDFLKDYTLKAKTNEEYYLFMLDAINLLHVRRWDEYLRTTLYLFLGYIENLGITTQELEQAYYDKNEINYKRLREGY